MPLARKKSPGTGENAAGTLDVTLTDDRFVGEIVLHPDKVILVFLRKHGGREFVRWRIFHRHRLSRRWYADKRRHFCIPVAAARALARAIAAGPHGKPITDKPGWVVEMDEHYEHRRRCL